MNEADACKIVITGPESTGKSTLAAFLSNTFSLPLVGEAARAYLSGKQEPYTQEDIRNIALIQAKDEANACLSNQIVICDTDLLTILIWQKEKYGSWDQECYNNWHINENKLYLLCAPDIPWVPDPLRENPDDRERLFKIYLELLQQHNRQFEIISGSKEQRIKKSFDFLQTFQPCLINRV